MKAHLFFTLAILISSTSYAQEKLEFETTGSGTRCYQPIEDAYQQAIANLQASADRICYMNSAIRVTEIVEIKSNSCLVRVKAGFICP